MATETESWKNAHVVLADTSDDPTDYACDTTSVCVNVDDKFCLPTIGGVYKYGWGSENGTVGEEDIAVTNPFVVSKLINGAKRLYRGGIEYYTGQGEDGGIVVIIGRVGPDSGRPVAVGRWVGGEVEVWSCIGDRIWDEYDTEGGGGSDLLVKLEALGEEDEEESEDLEAGADGGGGSEDVPSVEDVTLEGPAEASSDEGATASASDTLPPPPTSAIRHERGPLFHPPDKSSQPCLVHHKQDSPIAATGLDVLRGAYTAGGQGPTRRGHF